MTPKVEKLPIPTQSLGEGPHWSAETESLYFVDIDSSTIHRYHPVSEKHYSVKLDVSSLSFVIPVSGKKDQFLVGAGRSLFTVKWDGVSNKAEALESLCNLSEEPSDVRISEGKCDPFGRVWFANRRVAFDLKANGLPYFPDGMTIDSDGNLWVACYAGSRVIKVDPVTGELLDQFSIPVKNVTSVAWGGPDLSELYVTTNNVDNDDSDVNGGYTFRIKGLSAHGLPMSDFRL